MAAESKMVDYYSPAAGAVLQAPAAEAQSLRDAGYTVGTDEAKTMYEAQGLNGAVTAALSSGLSAATFHLSDAITPKEWEPAINAAQQAHEIVSGVTRFAGGTVPYLLADAATGGVGTPAIIARMATAGVGSGVETAVEASRTNTPLTGEQLAQSVGLGVVLAAGAEGLGAVLHHAVPAIQKSVNKKLANMVEEGYYKAEPQVTGLERPQVGINVNPSVPDAGPSDITLNRQANEAVAQDAYNADWAGAQKNYAKGAAERGQAAHDIITDRQEFAKESALATHKRAFADMLKDFKGQTAEFDALAPYQKRSDLTTPAWAKELGEDPEVMDAVGSMPKPAVTGYEGQGLTPPEQKLYIPYKEDSAAAGEQYNLDKRFRQAMDADDSTVESASAMDTATKNKSELIAGESDPSSPFYTDPQSPFYKGAKPPPLRKSAQGPLPPPPDPMAVGPEMPEDAWKYRTSKPDLSEFATPTDKSMPELVRTSKVDKTPWNEDMAMQGGDVFKKSGKERPFQGIKEFMRGNASDLSIAGIAGMALNAKSLGSIALAKYLFGGKVAATAAKGLDNLALHTLNNQVKFNKFLTKTLDPNTKAFGKVLRFALEAGPATGDHSFGSDNSDQVYQGIQTSLPKYATDPDALSQYYDNRFGHIMSTQPTLYQNFMQTNQQAMQYLYGQMPKDPRPPSIVPTPFDPPRADKVAFLHKVNALNDPMSMLQNPTIEGVAAVEAVYPETMKVMRSQLLSQLQNRKEPLTSQQAAKASLLLGQPVDASVDPSYLGALQLAASGQAGQAPQQPSSKPGPKPKKVTINKGFASISAPGSQLNEVENAQ